LRRKNGSIGDIITVLPDKPNNPDGECQTVKNYNEDTNAHVQFLFHRNQLSLELKINKRSHCYLKILLGKQSQWERVEETMSYLVKDDRNLLREAPKKTLPKK
jgi:hypothetical protein